YEPCLCLLLSWPRPSYSENSAHCITVRICEKSASCCRLDLTGEFLRRGTPSGAKTRHLILCRIALPLPPHGVVTARPLARLTATFLPKRPFALATAAIVWHTTA